MADYETIVENTGRAFYPSQWATRPKGGLIDNRVREAVRASGMASVAKSERQLVRELTDIRRRVHELEGAFEDVERGLVAARDLLTEWVADKECSAATDHARCGECIWCRTTKELGGTDG